MSRVDQMPAEARSRIPRYTPTSEWHDPALAGEGGFDGWVEAGLPVG